MIMAFSDITTGSKSRVCFSSWSLDRNHAASTRSLSTTAAGGRAPNKLPPADDDEYLAICIAVRNQHRELPELLQHHYHHLGIRRFYIMDDNSSPPFSTRTYGIPSSAITIQYFYLADHEKDMQYHIYNFCNEQYGARHTWIGYFDADEYLEMTGNETLVEFLHTFDRNITDQTPIGAVGISWRTHTSSGLEKRPPDGHCRKTFTECIIDDPEQDNRHIKSFVKTAYYDKPSTPHYFELKDGAVTVGEHDDVQHDSFRTPITRDRIALHHYGVKSKEQYMEKVQRGNAMGDPKDVGWWDHIKDMKHTPCPELALYGP
ncbi:MAG: hypothetical protein L6R40_006299 [Gallowayella cf. fulva]|nr:MAG: hypothetical protein L6R40_006299 [Xanthomendoza cf. fulva]